MQSNNNNNTLMIFVLCILVAVIINIDTAIAFQSSFIGNSNTKQTPTFVSRSSSKSTLFMKTIAVFGSSGLTASECIYQAVQNGDTVVGLTR
jgi:hypothetical protein